MSNLIRLRLISSAKALQTSVLPTPVGPAKRNEPLGLLSSSSPERVKITASTKLSTALS